MADLKLRIITDISQSQKELNKEVGSVNSLANALISTGKEGDKLINALERDLYLAASKAGNGLKSLQEQAKIVDKTFARLKVGVAETDDTYKAVAQASEYLHQQIDILTQAEKEATAAKKAHNEAMEKALALQKSLANIQTRTQGSVDFLSVTGGSEIEIAQAQLRGYEQTLHELIAAKGLENEETKKAIVAYNDQKDTVERLKQAQESLAVSVRQTVKENEKLPSSFNKLLSVAKNILKFQLLMGPITSVVRGIKNTLSDSVKLAAEAEQRFSKLATVFDGFGDSAKRMAQSLASAIGVANSTAASALSTVGDLLQAQGMGTGESLSTAASWVSAFQDIIAFKDINMSLEEFAQNFMSGAAGNLRNFRTFGSIVKESAVQAELAKKGLDKLTGSQLELAKMTTRAEMALSQQANAMGATKREWDTALSVNRRLNEEWKQYKENLGDTINTVLKPMRQWWAEVLEQYNKAKKAREEFNEGNKTPGVYDIKNNTRDMAAFYRAMEGIVQYNGGQNPLSTAYDVNALDPTQALVFKMLEENFIKFEATVEDIEGIFGNTLPDAIYDYLKGLEKLRKEEAAYRKTIEERRSAITTSISDADNFIEALMGITGVGSLATQDLSWMDSDFFARGADSQEFASKAVSEYLKASINGALENITASDLSVWGETISGALDELNGAELRQGMADSLKSLFEQAWNLYQQGNLDKASLEKVRTSYLDAKNALEQYNKALEAQAGLLTSLTSSRDAIAQRAGTAKYKNQGYEDNVASLMYSMEVAMAEATRLFNEGITGKTFTSGSSPVLEVGDQFMTLSQILKVIKQDYEEQIKAIEEATEAEKRKGAEDYLKGYDNDLDVRRYASANGVSADRASIMVSWINEKAELKEKFELLGTSTEKQAEIIGLVNDKYKEQLTALTSWGQALEEVKNSPLFQRVSQFKEDFAAGKEWAAGNGASEGTANAAGVGAGIAGFLAYLATQTEVFQEFLDILKPAIETMNNFLKPLEPAIQAIAQAVNALVYAFLEPLFPVIKIAAAALVVIGKVVETIAAAVTNVGRGLHNFIADTIGQLWGMERKEYVSIGGIWEDIGTTLSNIMGLTFEIAKNTDPKNDDTLKAYQEMYARGMITAGEFTALVNSLDGIRYDSLRTSSGYAWNNGKAGTTNIYYGDIKFTIDGTNLSADQIADAVARRIEFTDRTRQYSYA